VRRLATSTSLQGQRLPLAHFATLKLSFLTEAYRWLLALKVLIDIELSRIRRLTLSQSGTRVIGRLGL
jgi:hypothetical protein